MAYIYKIVPRNEWVEAEKLGLYNGSDIDAQDGFIHFSQEEQVADTANKHFRNQKDLLLICVDTHALDQNVLKYEISRGGALFPHLYGVLPLKSIVKIQEFLSDENGYFSFKERDD
ncbi:DUF952 domain-containing protein [Bartonella tamiae]|uniref:Dihydroorotate dehydrogenase n=1 Tax=Bartonella tamiae Th239 TaxID=1094558 RepID=J0ZLX5_9HYPH|nr:DUF952 domain-containing protein [Bartonella tamiae]EJF89403.1 hypothetical protein ME5_01954 [Bartonella tamiae Th239]EJF92732.1 hypothetical protein MEG_01902 [Bartonella tamiae Th307]